MVHSKAIYFCEIQILQKHLKVTANFYTYGKPVDAAIQHCTRHSTHGCQEMSSTPMPRDLPSAFWWQSFCANKNVFSVPLFSKSKVQSPNPSQQYKIWIRCCKTNTNDQWPKTKDIKRRKKLCGSNGPHATVLKSLFVGATAAVTNQVHANMLAE